MNKCNCHKSNVTTVVPFSVSSRRHGSRHVFHATSTVLTVVHAVVLLHTVHEYEHTLDARVTSLCIALCLSLPQLSYIYGGTLLAPLQCIIHSDPPGSNLATLFALSPHCSSAAIMTMPPSDCIQRQHPAILHDCTAVVQSCMAVKL